MGYTFLVCGYGVILSILSFKPIQRFIMFSRSFSRPGHAEFMHLKPEVSVCACVRLQAAKPRPPQFTDSDVVNLTAMGTRASAGEFLPNQLKPRISCLQLEWGSRQDQRRGRARKTASGIWLLPLLGYIP